MASSSSTTRIVALGAGRALASTQTSLLTGLPGRCAILAGCINGRRSAVAEPARHPASRPRGRPATARRGARAAGPRPATLVNWSLYRWGWLAVLLCGFLVLVAAEAPDTLRGGQLPQTFDGDRALGSARLLAGQNADRSPGSGGAARAAAFMEARLRALR